MGERVEGRGGRWGGGGAHQKQIVKATVQWASRTVNQEADALANGDTSGFNPALWCIIELSNIAWSVLPEVLEVVRVIVQSRTDL